jgi:hypothetical protein
VTRLRTEINEARERAGLGRIYLLSKGEGSLMDTRRQEQAKCVAAGRGKLLAGRRGCGAERCSMACNCLACLQLHMKVRSGSVRATIWHVPHTVMGQLASARITKHSACMWLLPLTPAVRVCVPCRERRRRRAKLERRRSRQRRRRQGEQLSGSGSESGSATDAADAADDEGQADGEAGALMLPGEAKRKWRSKSRNKRRSRQGGEGSDKAEGGGSSGSASDTEASDEETAETREQQRAAAAAAISGRTLPKIMFQLASEDRPEAAAAGRASGSDSWGSDTDTVRSRSRSMRRADSRRQSGVTTDGDGSVTGADSDGGGVAVPERIAQKRHRWTPQQDRQLLRWVVAQRVELGTRVQVGRAAGSIICSLGTVRCLPVSWCVLGSCSCC